MEDMARRADWLVRKPKFAIFPLHTIDTETGHCSCGGPNCSSPGKHPIAELAPHGVNDATTDPSQVAQWWGLWPDANIGVATGAASGVTVVDVDEQHGGMLSWHNLQRRHGDVMDTWMSRTGGGGFHVWFRYEEGLRNRVGMVPGVDLRSDGGYVVAPPSTHVSGNPYEWLEGCKPSASMQYPIKMPDWLITLAGGNNQKERAATVVGKISDGQRNNTLASLAGSMRRRGMEEDEILAALVVVNRNRCDPPLDEREVGKIAWSIGRMAPYTAEVQAAQWRGNG